MPSRNGITRRHFIHAGLAGAATLSLADILRLRGGLGGGQVVGATDSRGGAPIESPYRTECVLVHAYRHLGIDPAQTFPDFSGRPRNLLEVHGVIRELT